MKYLLSVGINRYKKSVFGDCDLQKCVFDSNNVVSKFNVDEVCELLDRNAIKSEVLSQINHYANRCIKGDTFIYYTSSHGTYYESNSTTTTGRVVHDNVIWDYEILECLSKFRKGVNIILISDCCHSESNSKLIGSVGTVRYTPTEFKPASNLNTSKVKARVAILSACMFNGVSLEFETGGLFTTTMLNIISPDMTWRKIISVIKSKIKNYQIPVIEHINGSLLINQQNNL